MDANSNPSQCKRILARLKQARGRFVPMPELAKAGRSLTVHSRIADLRRWGHKITNDVIQDGRVKHSFYRLED
jgi:hypothetical protein